MGKFYGENSTIIAAKQYYIPIEKEIFQLN